MTNTELRWLADPFAVAVEGTKLDSRLVDMFENPSMARDFGQSIINLIEENERQKDALKEFAGENIDLETEVYNLKAENESLRGNLQDMGCL